MSFLTQALAVFLAVVGQFFIIMTFTAESPVVAVACAGSVVCLWTAAWLLWRRTMT
jgi:hypothetical protein